MCRRAMSSSTKVSEPLSNSALTRRLVIALVAVIAGTLLLRIAAQTMSQMLQYYFVTINREYFPLPHSTRGLITASFFITELLGSLVLGSLSDRYGRRVFILLGPLLGAVAVQITAVTITVWVLVLTRLLEGLSTASTVPSTLGFISEATKDHPILRARVIGLFEITFVGGMAIGAKAGGWLWDHFHTPADFLGLHLISPAFCLNGLMYLVSLAVFALGVRDIVKPAHDHSNGPARGGLRHYARLMKSGQVWLFVPAWLAVNSIIGMWLNNSVGLLTGDRHHRQLLMGSYSPNQFGNRFAVLFFIFGCGILGWSLLMGRYRKTQVMLVSVCGVAASLSAIYGLNHLSGFPHIGLNPFAILIALGVLVMSGFTPAALTYLADMTESHSQDRGSIMGLYSVFLGIGQVIGTITGGFAAKWDGIDGLILLSLLYCAITVVSLAALRRQDDSQAIDFTAQPRGTTAGE